MPRKAISIDPEVKVAIARIEEFLNSQHMSVLALSQEAGVDQGALYRFLDEDRKTVTAVAKKVLGYIDKRHNGHNLPDVILTEKSPSDTEGARIISAAIQTIWDGKRASAKFIAALVLALKPAVDAAGSRKARAHKQG